MAAIAWALLLTGIGSPQSDSRQSPPAPRSDPAADVAALQGRAARAGTMAATDAAREYEAILRFPPPATAEGTALRHFCALQAGILRRQLGDPSAAERWLKESLAAARAIPDSLSAKLAEGETRVQIAGLLGGAQRYREAVEAFRQVETDAGTVSKLVGMDPVARERLRQIQVDALTGRTWVHLQVPEFDDAELAIKALANLPPSPAPPRETPEEREQRLADARASAAEVEHLRGLLDSNRGRIDSAEKHFRECLRLDPEHPTAKHNLADLLLTSLRAAEAESWYRRHLDGTSSESSPVEQARTLHGLAIALQSQGRLAEAKATLLRILDIHRMLTPDSMDLALFTNTLGNLERLEARFEQAERTLRKSLEIYRNRLPDSQQKVLIARNNLALALAGGGNRAAAAREFDRVRRGTGRYVAREAPGGQPGADHQAFLQTMRDWSLDQALSLALANDGTPSAERYDQTAEWLINGKGIVQEALADAAERRTRLAATNPAVRELGERLRQVRRELKMVAADGNAAERFADLERREGELSAELRAAGAWNTNPERWIALQSLRAALSPDRALVEIARLRPEPFDRPLEADRRIPERYVAWVIRAAGSTKVFDLGPAADLDAEVRRVRDSIPRSPTDVQRLLNPAFAARLEARTAQRIADVSRRLAPLLVELKAARRLTVCPDGELWMLPWELLRRGERYLDEDHIIDYVITGRDLLRARVETASLGPPLLFGAPVLPANLPSLDGSADEVRAVATLLKARSNVEPRILLGEQARAETLLSGRSPSELFISTHGFLDDSATFERLPMLRCGLWLSPTRGGDPRETGRVTATDLLGVPLRGTRLVVLSACETAEGRRLTGEGVLGLRQAFHLAGAESVVASLWKVEETATALLLRGFFAELAKGASRAEALRVARAEVRRTRPHPFFWAPFTITGHEPGTNAGR